MKLLKTALVCVFTALAIPAQATTVTLDLTNNAPAFSDGYVNNGDTLSAGDFSVTFKNVRTNGGNRSLVFDIGTLFGNNFHEIGSVDLIFNIDTIIDTYHILNIGNGGFRLSGGNGTSGLNSFGRGWANAFDMGTIPVFLAGETYTLTHTIAGSSIDAISALRLSSAPPPAAIPLPASLPLLLAGFGAVALLRRRTRSPGL